MVRNLPPRALLRAYGVMPTEPGGPTAASPPLRFYSWWFEDAECNDLSLRVSGDASAGGGLRRRYVTLDYDLASHTFSLQR